MRQIMRNIDAMGQARQGTNVAQAVRTATEFIQATWVSYLQGVQVVWSGGTFQVHSVSGEYVRSVQNGLSYPALGNPLMGEVISTSWHGRLVENGIRPFDMKDALKKSGKQFITIPFRHGTPGAATMTNMPDRVYEQAKGLAESTITGRRVDGGFSYQWGGRLGADPTGQRTKLTQGPGENAKKFAYTWKTGQFSGMVKMNGAGQTTYLTFRRMSVKSDPNSWQFPGVPPRPVTEAVKANTNEKVVSLIRVGFQLDIMDALGV
jgi:hypothetical protein